MMASASADMPELGSLALIARSNRGAICGQILNRAALHGAVPRGDDGGEIVRTEGLTAAVAIFRAVTVGCSAGIERSRRMTSSRPSSCADLIRDRIWRDVSPAQTGAAATGRASSTGVNARIGVSTPLSSTVKSAAVSPLHRLSFVVQDGHVDLDQFDAGAELRAVVLPCAKSAHTRHDAQAGEADSDIDDMLRAMGAGCNVLDVLGAASYVPVPRASCHVLRIVPRTWHEHIALSTSTSGT